MFRNILERSVECFKHGYLTSEHEAQGLGEQTPKHFTVHETRAGAVVGPLKVVIARNPEARAYPSQLTIGLRAGNADAKVKRHADVGPETERRGAAFAGRALSRRHHRIPFVEAREVSEHAPDYGSGSGDVDLRLDLGLAHARRR